MDRNEISSYNLSQLEEIFQSPVFELDCNNRSTIVFSAHRILQETGQFCMFNDIKPSESKIARLFSLYRNIKLLEAIKSQALKGNSQINGSLVGVYPTLKDPTCIFQLKTAAEKYVTSNVLPAGETRPKQIVKFLATKLTGIHPSTGNVVLVLRRK